MTTPEIVLRLGTHAEKDYVEKFAPMLDGLIIGANLLEATPGATSSLIVALCGAKGGINYYLDPMTYAFGAYVDPQLGHLRTDLDWIKSDQIARGAGKKKTIRDVKRSYKSLANSFGGSFAKAVGRGQAISAADIMATSTAALIAKSIVEYQLSRVSDEFEKDEEFKSYASDTPDPAAIFAPYFYCETSDWGAWLTANMRLIKESVNVGANIPLHAIICADASSLLDEAFNQRLRSELPKTGAKGVWLWFSSFYEDEAALPELVALKSLVQDLHSAGLTVFNMHGGYFSLTLSKHGMTGISHGIGYGEQKDVVPVIGQSVPTVRYYLPAIHKRLGVPDIERCFDALGIKTATDFHAKVCDCPVCKGIVSMNLEEFRAFGETQPSATTGLRLVQTPAAAKRCRFHFLVTRIRERDRVASMSVSKIQEAWNDASGSWGKMPVLVNNSKHLGRWKSALV